MISITDNRLSNLTSVCFFRYEQEINKRNEGENEFVMLKKVGWAAVDLLIGCIDPFYQHLNFLWGQIKR